MRDRALIERSIYLDQLDRFRDKDVVKAITGIRRSGKSSLMELMAHRVRASGVPEDRVVEMNFESMNWHGMDATGLYQHVKSQCCAEAPTYVFLDEVQRVAEWQKAIASLRVDARCDIYITGSNAGLLSADHATLLAGRYVEIHVYPLSFREFLDFVGETDKTPRELFNVYLRYGGMPGIFDVYPDQSAIFTVLDSVYSTVVMRDILERDLRDGERRVTDAVLLRKITSFLADSIGSPVSATSIGGTLASEGLIGTARRAPATQTVQAYVRALTEAFIFYETKRYDIKGRDLLRTLGKFYVADLGLRNILLGLRDADLGHLIENVVYFELLRRGYDVTIGKIGTREIDFIATRADDKKYFQVTASMTDPTTAERELAPLRAVNDNYEKIVLSLEEPPFGDDRGIKLIGLVPWLIGEVG